MTVSEKTGLRSIYFCITIDGQKHEIPAENARQANSIAEAKYGYAKIAVPPQESLVKKATDLEPIPVEDVEQERKDLPHGFKPTPDSIFCRVCGKAGTNPLHYKPVKIFPGKRDAGYADDSSRKARLHRALDAVMDARGAAKDAGETWKELIQKHFKLSDEQFYKMPGAELDKLAGQLQMAGVVPKPKGRGLHHPFTK